MPDTAQPAKSPVLNINDAELMPRPPQMAPTGPAAERFDGARVALIGKALGAQKLGYSLIALPPGKRAFPFHNHRSNEEMFYILEGEGTLRFGATTYPVKAGDVIACVPGDESVAHQFVNTGTTELKYLAVSTNLLPDVADYPDSGKFGVLDNGFSFIGRKDKQVPYWEGE